MAHMNMSWLATLAGPVCHFLHAHKALKADYLFLLILNLQHQFVNSIQKSLIVENNIWSRAITQRQY